MTAAFRNSSIGADDATPPNAGPARRAAAGLLSAAATAALLAGPVDAAALQSVSPTAATQHAASMSLGGMTQGRQGEAHQASLSELPASAPQLQLQAPILLADLSLPRFEGLPRLDNPFQVQFYSNTVGQVFSQKRGCTNRRLTLLLRDPPLSMFPCKIAVALSEGVHTRLSNVFGLFASSDDAASQAAGEERWT